MRTKEEQTRRQPPSPTVLHLAWAILLAISTAANIQFCLSLAGESWIEKSLWVMLGLAVEILIASLPFALRDQWRASEFETLAPTALIFMIAAAASLYAGLSFASHVRESTVAAREARINLASKIRQLEAKPTVAELQPQLDVLMADRRLGKCRTIRSAYGRTKCALVADLKTKISTAQRDQQTLEQLKSLYEISHTDSSGLHIVDLATVDPGSSYVVRWLDKLGINAQQSDVRLLITTSLVVMIWLGVMFLGVIAQSRHNGPDRYSRQSTAGPRPPNRPPVDPGSQTPSRPSKQPKRTKSEEKLLKTLHRVGQLEGSKTSIAEAIKVSRTTLDRALARLVDAGEILRFGQGSHVRVALAS